MPITPVSIGVLTTNLISTGMIGTDVPKYSSGVIAGLTQWVPTIQVQSFDVGTAGVGTNAPLPVLIPSPLLLANLTAGMASMGLIGPLSPLFILGLANGLVSVFLQTLVKTNHFGVGTGAGVATFRAPPAFGPIRSGFTSVGMSGEATTKAAQALAIGLDRTFASLFLPVAIVGPPSPAPGSGRGFGNII